MEEKLRRLMKHEGINSTRLAEILGIQASGISHIMSGRNKPSFDFLLKLLQRFPQINPDWLLLDKGPMYRDEIKNKAGRAESSVASTSSSTSSESIPAMQNGLFAPDNNDIIGPERYPQRHPENHTERHREHNSAAGIAADPGANTDAGTGTGMPITSPTPSGIERIVVFYKDKTFSEYRPAAQSTPVSIE